MTEELKKAEYPMNSIGLGFRGTMESGPYFKVDVDFKAPDKNYYGTFCGACAFWRAGGCLALEEEVPILSTCKLYIPMAVELELRHQSYMRRKAHEEEKSDGMLDKDEEKTVKMLMTPEDIDLYLVNGPDYIEKLDDAKLEFLAENTEGGINRDFEVKFAGMDEERKLVYGIVMEPDEVDSYGDTVTASEIEKAAHGYMMKPMVIGDGHTKKAKAQPVQSFIYDEEVIKEVKPGSWVMAVKVHSDKIWEGVKNGDYTGFSIGAMAHRIPLDIEEENDD